MNSITAHLEALRTGQPGAAENLLTEVYQSLHQIAASRLIRNGSRITMHPTELVNEAWIRLCQSGADRWENRSHFFAAAAEAMRRTLIDRARYRQRIKRGGERIVRHELCGIELIAPEPEDELLHLNEALNALEACDPTKASVVKLKFYCGMTIEEISSAMNLSSATVERYWAYSRVWLQHWIERKDTPDVREKDP